MLKPLKRAVHFDFHTMDDIKDFGENFDSEKFADRLRAANVEHINMFARCNLGYSYYPTKVGVKHPYLKGNLLGDVVSSCHKRGIKVFGYIHVGLNHEGVILHPDWLRVNEMGNELEDPEKDHHFFRAPCYNSSYSDHVAAELREVLDEGVDGIFIDGMDLRFCQCKRCLAEMKRDGLDTSDSEIIRKFGREKTLAFAKRLRDIVPSDKYFCIKGLPFREAAMFNSHLEVVCLPADMGYDYFPGYAAYTRNLSDNVLYMTGRFQMGWGDFGGYKGKAAIENDFYDALLNNLGTSLGDHLHPREIAEKDIYRDLGEIYSKIKKYEKWTDGARCFAEIAVLMSGDELAESQFGAVRMLSELKYTFDVIDVESDFSKYKVLIIPDYITFDASLSEKIKAYLANGGKVITSGTSGLNKEKTVFADKSWDFDYFGKDSCNAAYFIPAYENTSNALMNYSTYSEGILVKGRENGIVLAESVNPYFDRHWNGRHYYYYAPPFEKSGYHAALINEAGNVAHVSFRVFESYMKYLSLSHRELVEKILERFVPERNIISDKLPKTSRVGLTGKDNYKLLHIKATYPELRGNIGVVEEHNVIPEGYKVSVKGEYKNVMMLPTEEKINAEILHGYTHITLPEIKGYAMICLES